MLRRLLPRFPSFRSIISPPLLPLTSRLRTSPSSLPARINSVFSSPRPIHTTRSRSNSSENSTHDPSSGIPPNASLSERLKYLIKYYGWYALGVYFILSAFDFGVAFAAINVLGAEHVSRLAAAAKESVAGLIHSRPPEPGREEIESKPQTASGHEGLYAMLVLAYTVHKTVFLPVRVGLTAAFTPRIVAWLGRRGWIGVQGTRRAGRHMRDRLSERGRSP